MGLKESTSAGYLTDVGLSKPFSSDFILRTMVGRTQVVDTGIATRCTLLTAHLMKPEGLVTIFPFIQAGLQ